MIFILLTPVLNVGVMCCDFIEPYSITFIHPDSGDVTVTSRPLVGDNHKRTYPDFSQTSAKPARLGAGP